MSTSGNRVLQQANKNFSKNTDFFFGMLDNIRLYNKNEPGA